MTSKTISVAIQLADQRRRLELIGDLSLLREVLAGVGDPLVGSPPTPPAVRGKAGEGQAAAAAAQEPGDG